MLCCLLQNDAFSVFHYAKTLREPAYDAIIVPEGDETEVIAFVSGTKTRNQTVSVCDLTVYKS